MGASIRTFPTRAVDPWFRRRRPVTAGVALGLFIAISLVMSFVAVKGDAASVLFVLPVALLAMTFGLRGGLVGAAVGFGLLLLIWALKGAVYMSPLGWVVRGTAMFLMGFLLGIATDQIAAHERTIVAEGERWHELEEENRRYAEATEIRDSIVQHLVVAKWQLEQNRVCEAEEILSATIERSQEMVGRLLPRTVMPGAKVISMDLRDGEAGNI